jgi:hypothetical protein
VKYLFAYFFIAIAVHSHDFNVINGSKIVDMSDVETELDAEVLENLETNNYCAPNERNPTIYANVLKNRTGTLLSVGTFRALITFTLGQFERLIMLDVANNILTFNREHLNFIVKLSTTQTPAVQRQQYVERYRSYLEFFEKGGAYYWESDELWNKLVFAIQKNQIHVIRGNFGSVQANKSLLYVLKKLDTHITLDHSNLLQYVSNKKTEYSKSIEAFIECAQHHDVAILATSQAFNERHEYWPFVVGRDFWPVDKNTLLPLKNDDGIQWVYYYFPVGRAYLNWVEPSFYDRNKLEPIEADDWQVALISDQVKRLMLNAKHYNDEWIIDEVNNFLASNASINHLQYTPCVKFSESVRARVWENLFQHYATAVPAENLVSFENIKQKTIYCFRTVFEKPTEVEEFFKAMDERSKSYYDAIVKEHDKKMIKLEEELKTLRSL